jgi:ribosomal protein S28E/S33
MGQIGTVIEVLPRTPQAGDIDRYRIQFPDGSNRHILRSRTRAGGYSAGDHLGFQVRPTLDQFRQKKQSTSSKSERASAGDSAGL